jgi:hypothetical protein
VGTSDHIPPSSGAAVTGRATTGAGLYFVSPHLTPYATFFGAIIGCSLSPLASAALVAPETNWLWDYWNWANPYMLLSEVHQAFRE